MAAALRSFYFCMVIILSLTSLALCLDENQFIYHGFNQSELNLDNTAEIDPRGLLSLAKYYLRSGHAFYPFPFKFNTSSSQSFSFSTNFVVAMNGGHGMAFVISPSMDFSEADPDAYLGVFSISNIGLSTNHILAVELDAVQTPEFYDTDGNHVGIDVNGPFSKESARATYVYGKEGKKESLNLSSGKPIQIWIDYNGAEKLLNVTLAPTPIPKPNRPLLSKPLDLSQILLDCMYVGFSAATDHSASSQHYVLGWSFNRGGQASDLDFSKLPLLPPEFQVSTFPVSKESEERTYLKFSYIFFVPALVVLITICGAVYMVKKKKYEEVYEDWERQYGPQRFHYKNLYRATKGFSDKEIIGKGGFGTVYRGVLPSSNIQIAVKRVSHDSRQGMKEFVAEIASMGRLRHLNLVQLLGYCRRKGEFLLVYDYMPNGSLDKILYSKTETNLNWSQRFRIIRGIASGLLYLHEEWEQVVLHRDIKPGNVLLDADLNGRLGDFGLARLYDHGSFAQTTKIVGTFGYMAPELILRNGKASTSTDVYAFGVFMLEVACGRRPIQQHGLPETGNLIYSVTDFWKRGSILEASDPRLEGVYVEDQMELILKLGLLCSHPNPAARPSMRQVMQYLDGGTMLPDTLSDSAAFILFTSNDEAPDNEMPFPLLLGNGFVATMSTNDSILAAGR